MEISLKNFIQNDDFHKAGAKTVNGQRYVLDKHLNLHTGWFAKVRAWIGNRLGIGDFAIDKVAAALADRTNEISTTFHRESSGNAFAINTMNSLFDRFTTARTNNHCTGNSLRTVSSLIDLLQFEGSEAPRASRRPSFTDLNRNVCGRLISYCTQNYGNELGRAIADAVLATRSQGEIDGTEEMGLQIYQGRAGELQRSIEDWKAILKETPLTKGETSAVINSKLNELKQKWENNSSNDVRNDINEAFSTGKNLLLSALPEIQTGTAKDKLARSFGVIAKILDQETAVDLINSIMGKKAVSSNISKDTALYNDFMSTTRSRTTFPVNGYKRRKELIRAAIRGNNGKVIEERFSEVLKQATFKQSNTICSNMLNQIASKIIEQV